MKIAVVSGGLDSVTMAYQLVNQREEINIVAFDYGQRHRRELECARRCAADLDAEYNEVDLRGVGSLLTGSALTDDIDVPHGHYAAPNLAVTIVPNRNAIFLTVAFGIAVARNATAVATAVHGGDHFIYPDCREEFLQSFDAMQRLACAGTGHPDLHLETPFVNCNKGDIVRVGAELNVPFDQTWSCYEGGDFHCGKCGTCVERQEAFEMAGVNDPTAYRSL
jgi:7-cyano-7-deazaguanine synthase